MPDKNKTNTTKTKQTVQLKEDRGLSAASSGAEMPQVESPAEEPVIVEKPKTTTKKE